MLGKKLTADVGGRFAARGTTERRVKGGDMQRWFREFLKGSSRARVLAEHMQLPGLVVTIFALFAMGPARAQADECHDGPEGRTCTIHQPIISGALVPVELQKSLGLVTVGGGCSGTLLNRSWVLTADHCVTTNIQPGGPSQPFSLVPITATWTTSTVIPTRYVRYGTSNSLDVALIYLGGGDFGPANVQLLYVTPVSATETPPMKLTKYGQGLSVYAQPASGATPAQPASGSGTYRSAVFNPSSADESSIVLPVNSAGQVGAGGDSGGPDIVTAANGVSLGIASVQSTCRSTGYVPGQPQTWNWATGISRCTSAALYTIRADIVQRIQERPVALLQLHTDGTIWQYTGVSCSSPTSCPGWQLIDKDARVDSISGYYLRLADGQIWQWDQHTLCAGPSCPGWTLIDTDPRSKAIVAAVDALYQLQVDGKIWRFTGGACAGSTCPGWSLIDADPRTESIAVGISSASDGLSPSNRSELFMRQVEGAIWKWDGRSQCAGASCPGWTLINTDARSKSIVAATGTVFQLQESGAIWVWDGHSRCADSACPGWTLIDNNPETVGIAGGYGGFYQRHADGSIWLWDGHSQCSASACPGWTLINNDRRTKDIVAGGKSLFQRLADGSIWVWDRQSPCSQDGRTCPGWTLLDNNPSTTAISAVDTKFDK